jgi:hypothetical protein
MALVSGCAGRQPATQSADRPTVATKLPSCGNAPKAYGPSAGRITLTLIASSNGKSGSVLPAKASYKLAGTARLTQDLTQPADVAIMRDGIVVGAYLGPKAGTMVSATAVPESVPISWPVLLSGCPIGQIDIANPNATRRPLPAGTYELVAVMHAGSYAAPSLIVFKPVTVHVTD